MEQSGSLRLTRRGRVVVAVLCGGLVATVVALSATAGSAAGPQGRPAATVVREGDTLWRIATREFPGEDPYAAIDAIRRLNGITDYTVHVGEHLLLPISLTLVGVPDHTESPCGYRRFDLRIDGDRHTVTPTCSSYMVVSYPQVVGWLSTGRPQIRLR